MKKRKLLSLVTALALTAALGAFLPEGALRVRAAGSGTKDDPYPITGYSSLKDFAAGTGLPEGDVYGVIEQNIDTFDTINFNEVDFDSGRTYHLELDGNSIIRRTHCVDRNMFVISDSSTLIIEDSAGGGFIQSMLYTGDATDKIATFRVRQTGKLIINSGEIREYNYNNDLIDNLGEVEINDGVFKSSSYFINGRANSKTVINGGKFYYTNERSENLYYNGLSLSEYSNDEFTLNALELISSSNPAYIRCDDGLNNHINTDATVKVDGTALQRSSLKGTISGMNMIIYTPDDIQGIEWNKNTVSWDKYKGAASYKVTLQKVDQKSNTFDNIGSYDILENSLDLTDAIKAKGIGVYRVGIRAFSVGGDQISYTTHSALNSFKGMVSKVNVTITEPINGETRYCGASVTTEGAKLEATYLERRRWVYTPNIILWYEGNSIFKGAFEDGKTYTAEIRLIPDLGYLLSPDTKVYVNGKPAEFATFTESTGALVCKRSYTPGGARIPGDANGDKQVSIMDVLIIRQHMAGWAVDIDLSNADVNGDNKVDILDVLLIRQSLAGWNVTLV